MCNICKNLCHKVIASVVIIVALILAITISVWPQKNLDIIMFATRFFDVMIPALAVGALLKYLLCGNFSCGCGNCDETHKCKKK